MGSIGLIVWVWLWEAFGIVVVLSLYRMEDKHDLPAFLSHLDGRLFLAGAILFGCITAMVAWSYLALQRKGSRPLRLIVTWNILPLILISTIAEGALRVFSTDTPSGTMLGEQPLGPHRLDVLVPHYTRVSNEIFYYDQLLGWTVRPNLSTSDGLYFTSVEGLRSSRPGSILADSRATCRIALVGDSHTFGYELKFEETWGYHLESYLPKGCQVLNFAVPGHSVGQMYLRFLRDVRPWHPDAVVLALSSHSAARTMGVYGLNMFPQLFPWAQPRFQLKDHELIPVNVPLPPLESIATARSMSDLPFIDSDWFFVPGNWELPRWRYLYNSYLFRLYITRFPAWRTQHNGDSEETINHELFRSFLRAAKSDGSTTVVLYLPDKNDYKEPAHQEMPSLRILRTSGIEYFDLRSCLDNVDADDRFIPHGGHYSLNGSIAIARCVAARLPSLGEQIRPLAPENR
jgi:hypothetical protein